MNSALFRAGALALGALTACTQALAGPVTIADLAPPQSIGVIGVDDFGALRTAMEATTLDELLAEPSVQAWLKSLREGENSPLKGLDEKLAGVDAKLSDIGWPVGMAGVALWVEFDKDADDYLPRWIIAADYADRAEKVDGLIEELIEQGIKDGELELKDEDVDDIDVRAVTVKQKQSEHADEEEMGDEEGEGMLERTTRPTVIFQSRVGNVLVLASDMGAMERAVDRLKGDDMPCLGDAPEYATAMAQAGSAHVRGALMVRPLMQYFNDLYARAQAGHWNAMAELPMAPGGIADALGLSEITSASFGARFDAEGAILETTGGVATPSKKGLAALFDLVGEAFTPPGFVGADTASLTMFKIDFRGIIPLLQQFVAALPQEQQQQAGGLIAIVAAQAAPLLQSIGPDVCVAARITRPFGPESESSLIALRATDPPTVAAMINQFAPNVGLAARDFEGFQIWEAPPEAGAPFVVGLGGGQVFVGAKDMVEGALRSAGRPDALRLADDESFKRATAQVGAGGAGYSFTELRPSLEYARWRLDNYEAIVRAKMAPLLKDPDIDPEMAREWLQHAIDEAKPSDTALKTPPPDVILRHIGDSVSEWRSTSDGFRFRQRLLAPQKN